jgi:hypothetical protein
VEQMKLTSKNAAEWVLEAPFILDRTESLTQSTKSSNSTDSKDCWDAKDRSVHICASSDGIISDIRQRDGEGDELWGIHLQYAPVQTPPQYETPKSFSLSEAMELSSKMSFDSRIEYEHVLQAKHGAKAAHLNLLPHLNISDVFNNLTPSFGSLAASVGDLAPFLLPTRWLQAKNAAINAQVESDINHLVRLTIQAQVEGLAYALKRDQEIVKHYQYLVGRTQDAHDQVWALEQKSTLPVGAANHLQAVIESMRLDMAALSDVLASDRAALSQSLGLLNPEAVADMTFDSEALPIEQAKPLNEEEEAKLAIERSLELDELDHLIQIAKNQKTGISFNWLDPAGDYTQNLGFNLGEDIQIASSQIHELEVRKEQLQSGISQNLFSYVHSFNTPAQTWGDIASNVALQETRLNQIMTTITPNSGLSTLDIEGILQDYLAAFVRQEQTLAEFRVARAQIDRALFQGAYAALPFDPK